MTSHATQTKTWNVTAAAKAEERKSDRHQFHHHDGAAFLAALCNIMEHCNCKDVCQRLGEAATCLQAGLVGRLRCRGCVTFADAQRLENKKRRGKGILATSTGYQSTAITPFPARKSFTLRLLLRSPRSRSRHSAPREQAVAMLKAPMTRTRHIPGALLSRPRLVHRFPHKPIEDRSQN